MHLTHPKEQPNNNQSDNAIVYHPEAYYNVPRCFALIENDTEVVVDEAVDELVAVALDVVVAILHHHHHQ
jgi:hypothetical protein